MTNTTEEIVRRVLYADDPEDAAWRLPHAACTPELAERLADAGADLAAVAVVERLARAAARQAIDAAIAATENRS